MNAIQELESLVKSGLMVPGETRAKNFFEVVKGAEISVRDSRGRHHHVIAVCLADRLGPDRVFVRGMRRWLPLEQKQLVVTTAPPIPPRQQWHGFTKGYTPWNKGSGA